MKWRGRRESRNVIDYRDGNSPNIMALGHREVARRSWETMERSVTAPELGKKFVEGQRKVEAVNRKALAESGSKQTKTTKTTKKTGRVKRKDK